MPYRNTPFVPGEFYHILNRSIARQPISKTLKDYQRFINVVNYYRFEKLPMRYSHFYRLSTEQKDQFSKGYLMENKPMLNIVAFCIMPNHFHFILQPFTRKAISNFMRIVQNSYSKYYNTKYERTGSLFQFMFKAIHIETGEQLLHVSRYIHLNPVTSYLIEIDKLQSYPWSSFRNYLSGSDPNSFVEPAIVLKQFKSTEKYKAFVFDQVNYQRELGKIKHLALE